MKLTTLPALAVAASCAANAPDVKPNNVDLHAAQTRDALLALLGADHEGPQDNGDFVQCTSINDTTIQSLIDKGLVKTGPAAEFLLKDEAKRSAVTRAGLNACDPMLDAGDEDRCWGENYDVNLKKDRGIFSTTTYCGPNHAVETTCTASVPIKATIANSSDACVRVRTAEDVSVTRQTPSPSP